MDVTYGSSLYKQREKRFRPWPRWLIIAWLLVLVGFTLWLLLDVHFFWAAIFAVAAIPPAVAVIKQDWDARS